MGAWSAFSLFCRRSWQGKHYVGQRFMKGFLHLFERDIKHSCCLRVHSKHIWHLGGMGVAEQVSLNPIFHSLSSQSCLNAITLHWHCILLVYITTYSTMQDIHSCNVSQCRVLTYFNVYFDVSTCLVVLWSQINAETRSGSQ